jgi:hypothetical protein
MMQDNTSDHKSEEMMHFLQSARLQEFPSGIHSHFRTPKEQWQTGAAESTINSIMTAARTVMTESGLG